ncbi:hypothetical protein DR980_15295 [Flavobacterium psychrolimnae]|uniref:Uncharacterized protein n=1 Tax=Flavobacterium psychrolimnae TaxID=249351 RepID=A0A366AWH9_9FLAO|nr:hypothetical protein DR980_15295 [Flavobacterium psychrolimnae]
MWCSACPLAKITFIGWDAVVFVWLRLHLTSGCEKTSSNLESIRRATKEQSQIWDSQEVLFSFFMA